MNIYTASSWKNPFYSDIVRQLKEAGHQVYDFRSAISSEGADIAFNWDQIDPQWERWTDQQFIEGLSHPLAANAFRSDYNGMRSSDVCVLVLPCGKSAHIEAGYMKGMGKKLYILMSENDRPELTYLIADGIFRSVNQLLEALK